MSFEKDAELISRGFFLLYITGAIKNILSDSPPSHDLKESQQRALRETADFFSDAAAAARFIVNQDDFPRTREGSYWNPLKSFSMVLEDGSPIRKSMDQKLAGKNDREIETYLRSFSDVFAKGFPQQPTAEEREILQIAQQFFDGLHHQNRVAWRSRHPPCSGGSRRGFAPA